MKNVHVVSYNCRGFDLNDIETISLLQKYEIVCFQETWLSSQQCNDINTMLDGYRGVANSPNDDTATINIGRQNKKEGVSIMWHSKWDNNITPIKFEYEWVVGIKIYDNNKLMYIVNVYLPYECSENEDEFVDRLSKLNVLLDELDSTCVTIVGDFNSNINKPNSCFAKYLSEYCDLFKYKWSSINHLPADTYTYISDAWGSQSWLDHCISTQDSDKLITDMSVLYGNIVSDHIPLCIELDLQLAPTVDLSAKNSVQPRVNWSKVSESDMNAYTFDTDHR